MSDLPYMKLWVGDHLSKTLHLNMEQFGSYTQLLLAMWSAGGSLSADPKQLAMICRVTQERWQQRIAPAVMPFFTVVETSDGKWLQSPRLSEELQIARNYQATERKRAR